MAENVDKQILELVWKELVFWTKHQGGSEPYQRYHDRIHELESMGYLQMKKHSCCKKEWFLTAKGRQVLGINNVGRRILISK